MSESYLLALAGVIVLGVGAQWAAWRLGIASILLLLIVGFLVGPVSGHLFGRPLLDPDGLLGDLLLPFVMLSVALILYEGGISLRFAELGEGSGVVWRLVTVGAAATWLLTAVAARFVLGLETELAILLGAILVVSGPTVVIPLLWHIRPAGRIGAILKWEGIVIDPIGAMLAVLVFEVIVLRSVVVSEAAPHVALTLVRMIVVGGAFGYLGGLALVFVIRWFWVPDYLENAVSIMFVVGVFTAAHRLQPESGLLATTVMGITLGNQKLVDVKHIAEFKENLRVLLISSLFILLAARMRLEELEAIGVSGLVFLLVLMIVVRPLSVLLSSIGATATRQELTFLAVMAPRGIVAASVAAVFALRLQPEYPEANVLVPMTFLVIVGTVLGSSLLAPPVARRLGLADPRPQGILLVGAHRWGRMLAEAIQRQGFRVLVVDTNRHDLGAARMAGLETHGDSILAEHLFEDIDLGGIGRLIAATPNDWVNILAVNRFLRIFGRGEVYQVAPEAEGERDDDAHRHLHGRRLFEDDLTFERLQDRVARGAVVKTTTLTDAFTFQSFQAHYGAQAIPLFVITASGRLDVIPADETVEPRAGDTLISLVDRDAEPVADNGGEATGGSKEA